MTEQNNKNIYNSPELAKIQLIFALTMFSTIEKDITFTTKIVKNF